MGSAVVHVVQVHMDHDVHAQQNRKPAMNYELNGS